MLLTSMPTVYNGTAILVKDQMWLHPCVCMCMIVGVEMSVCAWISKQYVFALLKKEATDREDGCENCLILH